MFEYESNLVVKERFIKQLRKNKWKGKGLEKLYEGGTQYPDREVLPLLEKECFYAELGGTKMESGFSHVTENVKEFPLTVCVINKV